MEDKATIGQKETRMVSSDGPETAKAVASDNGKFSTLVGVLRFAIFADAINGQILGPNYALMVLVGGGQDSFPSTAPFDFGAANYFLPMTADLGMVLSSLVFGRLSDKIGRKKSILACMYLGAAGSILKYFVRHNFLLFCAASFATGLFGGSLAIGMAYVSDMFSDRQRVDAEIGALVAVNMLGRTGGGIAAILMQSIGLFEPLWVSAVISLLAGFMCHYGMQDMQKPQIRAQALNVDVINTTDDISSAAGDSNEPQKLDKRALWTVLAGELADNLGSMGLVPFCLSPLMFNTFYSDFREQELDPVMSATAYKWIYVVIAFTVVPGAILAPHCFKRFGPALSASAANILTGLLTLALLWIASAEATVTTFSIFVAVLYTAFPLTVISQLSTGPMMDRIAPESQRGELQGYNMATMTFSGAVGLFFLGLLMDATNIAVCLYTTFGLSILAAIINYPLSKHPRLGPFRYDELSETERSPEDDTDFEA